MKQGFTLIELLVVIAIIAILAAIIFPVFASARERAKVISCTSNLKQLSFAFLAYEEDFDEAVPVGYNGKYMYGPMDAAQYNTTVQPIGQPTGMAAQLYPYVKTWNVFACPDDHLMDLLDAQNYNKIQHGFTAATQVNHTWAWLYGTSYTFTHEAESNPFSVKTITGYATSMPCKDVAAGSSIPWVVQGQGSECDVRTDNEQVKLVTSGGNTGFMGDGHDVGAFGYGNVTINCYARPSQTRIMHEAVETFLDDPASTGGVRGFHPGGTVQAFADGHVQFLTSITQYHTGCDGLDFAFDIAGSCNTKQIQRSVD